MDTKRSVLMVVGDGEIVVPEPTEDELLALAQERVGGKVTAAEFLAFPNVRDAMTALYRRNKLAEIKALRAAEDAAKRVACESALAKLLADIAGSEAEKVKPVVAPAVIEQPTASVKTVVAKPEMVRELEPKIVVRPLMPALGQGEVLNDSRAIGIIQNETDPQTGVKYPRFAKEDDLLRYKEKATGHWWCMVTGRLAPDNLILVVGAVLVCEKSHADRIAKKSSQNTHTISRTLDWLRNNKSATRASKKLQECLAEKEKIQVAVSGINSIDKLTTEGFALLHTHQPDTWQFRATQALLSQNVGGILNAFEADLPERFPNRGSVEALRAEINFMLNKRREVKHRSFEGFVYQSLVGKLFKQKEALECQATLRGHGATKKRSDKEEKLAKEAKSRGIDTTDKTEAELKSAIADHERAKASRKGAKPGYGRRS